MQTPRLDPERALASPEEHACGTRSHRIPAVLQTVAVSLKSQCELLNAACCKCWPMQCMFMYHMTAAQGNGISWLANQQQTSVRQPGVRVNDLYMRHHRTDQLHFSLSHHAALMSGLPSIVRQVPSKSPIPALRQHDLLMSSRGFASAHGNMPGRVQNKTAMMAVCMMPTNAQLLRCRRPSAQTICSLASCIWHVRG